MNKRWHLHQLLLLLMIVPYLSGPVSADDSRVSFQLNWENDLPAGMDHGFTNGMKLTWVTPLNLVRTKGNRGNGASADLRQGILFSIGQNMYTPRDIRATALIGDDRPYAGMLFGELGIVRRKTNRM
ncbi:MAG: lipid A deacylase LpxR family protein, partial [Candidatus Aminicenantes bacterium]|nr:lipid A deacylase LpxR family protein [Candidatus Aminicenantes bacterium]